MPGPGAPATATLTRGGCAESVHLVHLAVADGSGRLLASAGDPGRLAFMRSSAKPLQALPLVESGAAAAFGLDAEDLAIACASHEGASVHQAAVRRLLAKIGLGEDALRCGTHAPADTDAAASLAAAGERPRPIHNNCSGKHAGMLATCVHRDWSREYLAADHPLQRWIREIVEDTCGESPRLGVDGCGVPTFAVSLRGMATAFARLGSGADLPPGRAAAAQRLAAAMAGHPVLVSGRGSANTVMLARQGERWMTKGGAEGVWCLGLRGGARPGLGLAVKVQDGNHRASTAALLEAMAALGLPGSDDPALAPLRRPPVVNTLGAVVGETLVELPATLAAAGLSAG